MNQLIKRIEQHKAFINGIVKVLNDCHAEILRLEAELAKAKEYVPMTDAQLSQFMINHCDEYTSTRDMRALEAEVIKRAGMVVKGKE